ncbi:MAG: hypothetical protein WA655_09195 [Candidatus Korobacteraceae bacterium]
MLPLRCVWQRNVRPVLIVLWELQQDGLQFLEFVAGSRAVVAAALADELSVLNRAVVRS